jgi:NADPH-dependent curcumin reductase CurA
MVETLSGEIHLKNRPVGLPGPNDFELVQLPIPDPGPGEVLVRNIYMSVDPYMRGLLRSREGYVPAVQIGEPLTGACVGQVTRSNNGRFPVGVYVMSFQGWREYYVSNGSDLTTVDPSLAPIQSFLGVVGMPGLTAYVGLLDIGQLREGDHVFVSAASGAVGSVACQIAKIKGCRVVGSAGSDTKVDWLLSEVGIDAAFNYKQVKGISDELAKHFPDGIDLYFDNVGEEHLEAAIYNMAMFGRIVLCGMISQYNATEPVSGLRNLSLATDRRLTLRGFIVLDHEDRLPDFYEDMKRWIAEGRITWRETILDGLENAPKAFIGLFRGDNIGKMLVKIGPDPAA